MSYKMVIVESPQKAKTIQKYLGEGYRVVASLGHVWDLPKNELGFSPPDFTPKYVPVKDGKAIATIQSAARNASEIFLASDPDREGEAISAHLARILKLPRPKRVRFNEVSKAAIVKALASPTTIDQNLVAAQEVRRLLDRMVGYLVSPRASELVGVDLSAGRVQSPAVRLVVEREREIKAFVPTAFYDVFLRFETAGVQWAARWDPSDYLQPNQTHCTDKALAADIATTSPARVTSVNTGPAQRRPPAPFTTSTLQKTASVRLKMRPAETMRLAQLLKDTEPGLITYHRTDNPNISDDSAQAIRSWLTTKGHKVPQKLPKWKAKEGAQTAHEAIRPVNINLVKPEGLEPAALALYELIWLRAVASQMTPAVYDATQIVLEGTSSAGRQATFVASGRTLIDPGWLALDPAGNGEGEGEEDDTEEGTAALPRVKEGATLTPTEGEVDPKKTRPPPRFTEASLIDALEAMGIGRPSTYAAIMTNITDRGYVTLNKKQQLSASPLGDLLVTLLSPMRFMDYEFTRNLETYLDKLAQGESTQNAMLLNMYTLLQSENNRLSPPPAHLIPEELKGKLSTRTGPADETFPCPKCGRGILRRIPAKKGHFWGCSNFKAEKEADRCSHTQPDVNGRPGSRPPPAAATPHAITQP